MIEFLLGALITFAIGTSLECYFLIGRAQLLLNHAELLLGAAARLLSRVAGTSATPTIAPADLQPRRWWQRLRKSDGDQADDEPQLVLEVDLEPAPEEPEAAEEPVPDPAGGGPPTVPAERVVDDWHRDVTTVMPEPDAVDVTLSRFTFTEGHHR